MIQNASTWLRPNHWTDVGEKIDTVLRRLRSTSLDPRSDKPALTTLLGSLN